MKKCWFYILLKEMKKTSSSFECEQWGGMWDVEKLYMALKEYSDWALEPEDREENRREG